MSYFIVSCSEDGDTSVSEYTAEQLEAKLNGPEPDYKVGDFNDKMSDFNANSWSRKMILIKGEIIMPKVKEVVTKVTLEGT